MPGVITEITELATALGTLAPDLADGLRVPPPEIRNVAGSVWTRLRDVYEAGAHGHLFEAAHANGVALLEAEDGLRGRRPRLVEWKGPHRPPGDDVIPADLRIDHVYLVSCKYLSKVLLNAGPARLFQRSLVGEERSGDNWFHVVAPEQYRELYRVASDTCGLSGLPEVPGGLTRDQQRQLREAFASRALPVDVQKAWSELCHEVSAASAARWRASLPSKRAELRLLWRLLRMSNATYFVLGADRSAEVSSHLRLRVASTWDWNQAFELRELVIEARPAGQPEVAWRAVVRDRATARVEAIEGHVEIRWSHGRFVGAPEAKVYLDTRHVEVAGYEALG